MMERLLIHDPRAKARRAAAQLYPKIDGLQGKTMVVLNNHWTCMDEMIDHLGAALKSRHGVKEVIQFDVPVSTAVDEAVIAEAARLGDFVVVGLAN